MQPSTPAIHPCNPPLTICLIVVGSLGATPLAFAAASGRRGGWFVVFCLVIIRLRAVVIIIRIVVSNSRQVVL
jgi:hypothetical protein